MHIIRPHSILGQGQQQQYNTYPGNQSEKSAGLKLHNPYIYILTLRQGIGLSLAS